MMNQILSDVNRTKTRFFLGAVIVALLAILLPACTASADEEAAAETGGAVADSGEDIELFKRFSSGQDAGMEHFVGAVDENLFVGMAVPPRAAENAEPRTLAVYLCDGETVTQWIVQEIAGQEATLADGDTNVEVTIAEDSVSGTVALDGGEPRPFTAGLATGDAGLYRAEWNLAGIDYQMDWIVLPDGRQRGSLDGKGNDVYPPPRIVN